MKEQEGMRRRGLGAPDLLVMRVDQMILPYSYARVLRRREVKSPQKRKDEHPVGATAKVVEVRVVVAVAAVVVAIARKRRRVVMMRQLLQGRGGDGMMMTRKRRSNKHQW